MSRRIYIHKDSLKTVCQRSYMVAETVIAALLETNLNKMFYTHIESALNDYDKNAKALIESNLYQAESASLTEALALLGFRDTTETAANRSLHPVLRNNELIHASCFDDGYYTFATDNAASDRMFKDKEPMKELRNRLLAGDTDTNDLTIIRGRNLFHYSEIETADQKKISSKYFSAEFPGKLTNLKEIASDILNRLIANFDYIYDALSDSTRLKLTKKRLYILDQLHFTVEDIYS